MKHYHYEEWLQYVRNEVSEKDRQDLESHLYTCDQCLEQYLQAVEAIESSLPILSNEVSFTDLVMAEVTVAKPNPKPKKPFYQQAAFHYFLAAAATVLLTLSGVFHSIATYAGEVENPKFQEKRSSLTEGVLNKTFSWMDSLEKKEANK